MICIKEIQEEIFILPNNKVLCIKTEALEKMFKYRQLNLRDTEAGGILIGRILLEDENYIIDDVSEPVSTDIRKRTRFIRKPEGHQEYFNSVWVKEEGSCFYLGEWHTHPQKIPIPSKTDRKEWNRLLNIEFESDSLFFIIIGTDELKVWYGKELKEIELKRRDNLE